MTNYILTHAPRVTLVNIVADESTILMYASLFKFSSQNRIASINYWIHLLMFCPVCFTLWILLQYVIDTVRRVQDWYLTYTTITGSSFDRKAESTNSMIKHVDYKH